MEAITLIKGINSFFRYLCYSNQMEAQFQIIFKLPFYMYVYMYMYMHMYLRKYGVYSIVYLHVNLIYVHPTHLQA